MRVRCLGSVNLLLGDFFQMCISSFVMCLRFSLPYGELRGPGIGRPTIHTLISGEMGMFLEA
jgi:hypothetical protein